MILLDVEGASRGLAALLVDGRLEDLLLDPRPGDTTPVPGEIHWAKMDRRVPKIGGAFVRLASGHQGFLREAKGLRDGAAVTVQVLAHAEPGKATPVTRKILYKERCVIHTPEAPGLNLSRRIRDRTLRDRVTVVATEAVEAAAALSGGFIIRSAAAEASAAEIGRDIRRCLDRRRQAEAIATGTSPAIAERVPTPAFTEAAREWTGTRCDLRVICSAKARETAAELLASLPGELVETSTEGDLLDAFGIWEEIDRLRDARAPLGTQAWMTIEPTTALVAVDINTGGDFSAAAGLSANLAAARELPRQLRLRGLGGQITVDMAPMTRRDRPKVEQALRTAFRTDPIETTLAGWTPLGHFELQRKRERRPLSEIL